jgi:hypothetical protein
MRFSWLVNSDLLWLAALNIRPRVALDIAPKVDYETDLEMDCPCPEALDIPTELGTGLDISGMDIALGMGSVLGLWL